MKPFLVALMLTLCGTSAGAETGSPEATMQAFYGWLLKSANAQTSLPSVKERTALAKMLSGNLIALLEEASKTEAQCIKAAPKDAKPLIVEGGLFVGNYEGATEAFYDEPKQQGDAVSFDVSLFYVSPSYPKGHRLRGVAWKDVVRLAKHDGRWIIDDILFRKDSPDAERENASLSGELKSYIADGKSCFAH